MTRTIGIFAFDNVELLDLAGPYEVFTCASRFHARMHPGTEPPFKVLTIGQSAASLRARAGLGVFPDASFANHSAVDVLMHGRVPASASGLAQRQTGHHALRR